MNELKEGLCVVSCPIDTFSGYGARSRDFVRELIRVKGDVWDIKILPQVWGATPGGFLDPTKDLDLTSRLIPNLTRQPEIWMQITVPNEFQPVGKYNIGVTAGIESTHPPMEWIDGCNRMNMILASSNFTKNTFSGVKYSQQDQNTKQQIREIKLEKPMEVVFEGLDLEVYNKKPQKSGMLEDVNEYFCFLFTGHWLPGSFGEDRKNVSQLIYTFIDTFKNKPTQPALLLKCSMVDYSLMDKHDIEKRINKIKDKFEGHKIPNIYLLHGEFTNEELNLINNDPKVKAFISFTKGEGFGRPLLEQAITGKPVITTNWSGHVDFIRPEFNILLGGNLTKIHPSAAGKMLLKEASWFTVDPKVASKAMKDVYKNYKRYIAESRKQTKYLKENFSKEKMGSTIKGILDEKVKIVTENKLVLPTLTKKEDLPTLKLPKLKV